LSLQGSSWLSGSMPFTSSPSGSLPEVRFSRVLVSPCVGSLICLQGWRYLTRWIRWHSIRASIQAGCARIVACSSPWPLSLWWLFFRKTVGGHLQCRFLLITKTYIQKRKSKYIHVRVREKK
jgi:hypothetical protein